MHIDFPAIAGSLIRKKWDLWASDADALQKNIIKARKMLLTIPMPSTLISGTGFSIFEWVGETIV